MDTRRVFILWCQLLLFVLAVGGGCIRNPCCTYHLQNAVNPEDFCSIRFRKGSVSFLEPPRNTISFRDRGGSGDNIIMSYSAKIDSLKNSIIWQWVIIAFLFLWASSATIGWLSAPKNITMNVGPNLPNEPLVMGIYDADKSAVWQFSQYFLSVLHTWPKNGEEDYLFRLTALRQMGIISQTFYTQFHGDYLDRIGETGGMNTIRGIQRLDHTPLEYAFDPTYTQPWYVDGDIKPGVWTVSIVMQTNETMNNETVRDPLLRYTLKVKKTFENIEGNDWGLQLDALIKQPERLTGR